MPTTRSIFAASALFAACVSVANAEITLPIALNGGVGTRSVTSVAPVEVSPSYAWTLDLSSMAATGLTGSLFGMPFAMPLYGANPVDLVMAGAHVGGAGNLVTRNFTFTDLGAVTPAYDFTVSLDLLPDQTLQTTITVNSLGSFMPGGIVPSNPIPLPVTSVNAGGMATIAAVPTPGTAALVAAGSIVALRRRRN